ncbi:MAG: hypothetical protein H0T42_06840 [Deltaproteobacteria bacterium]|nr:hypothetical protein [Deltaproteobacteria bacterium]
MIWLRATALLAVLGCGSSKPAPAGGGGAVPITGELPDSCAASEDCELVEACCGCSAGGKQIAIRKDAVAGFEAARPQRCGDSACVAVMSTDPSCSAEAVCGQSGRCEVAPHMGQTESALPPAQ